MLLIKSEFLKGGLNQISKDLDGTKVMCCFEKNTSINTGI